MIAPPGRMKTHFFPNFSERGLGLSLRADCWLTVPVAREGNGTPFQYSCLENPMDGGAWWAAVHGVVKSRTRLSGFTFAFHFHALEEEMATHSSILAWRIPWTEKPGGLQSVGSQSRTRLKQLGNGNSSSYNSRRFASLSLCYEQLVVSITLLLAHRRLW